MNISNPGHSAKGYCCATPKIYRVSEFYLEDTLRNPVDAFVDRKYVEKSILDYNRQYSEYIYRGPPTPPTAQLVIDWTPL